MKLKEFQKHLKTNQINSSLLFDQDPKLIYLTQFKPSAAILQTTSLKSNLYLFPLDNPKQQPNITYKNYKKQTLKNLTKNKTTLAINKNNLSLRTYEQIKSLNKKIKLVDISKQLTDLAQTKTPKEISLIKKACQITSNAFNSLRDNIHKLKTENDVAFFLEKQIRQSNATLAFDTIVATKQNASTPHHITSNTKLKKGFLLLDFGAKYKNYCADMTRMLYLGKPTKQEKAIYSLLLNAQETTINQIKQNKPFQELTNYARKQLKTYQKHFTHSLGHGIGIQVHEDPFFKPNSIIKKDQVFTIEPGIYLKNKFGLRIEDTIHFNGKKPTILTKAPKELIAINHL